MGLFVAAALTITAATAAFMLYRHLQIIGANPEFGAVFAWQAVIYGLWAPVAVIVWRAFERSGLTQKAVTRYLVLGLALIPFHALGATFIDIFRTSPGATDLIAMTVQRLQLNLLIYACFGLLAIAAQLHRRSLEEAQAAAEIRQALERAREQLGLHDREPAAGRLAVSAGTRRVMVDPGEVEWFGSASNYVVVNWQGREGLIRNTLQSLEQTLDPVTFARIHRGTIVNLSRVESAEPLSDGSWRLHMGSGTELVASRTYRNRILERLSSA